MAQWPPTPCGSPEYVRVLTAHPPASGQCRVPGARGLRPPHSPIAPAVCPDEEILCTPDAIPTTMVAIPPQPLGGAAPSARNSTVHEASIPFSNTPGAAHSQAPRHHQGQVVGSSRSPHLARQSLVAHSTALIPGEALPNGTSPDNTFATQSYSVKSDLRVGVVHATESAHRCPAIPHNHTSSRIASATP